MAKANCVGLATLSKGWYKYSACCTIMRYRAETILNWVSSSLSCLLHGVKRVKRGLIAHRRYSALHPVSFCSGYLSHFKPAFDLSAEPAKHLICLNTRRRIRRLIGQYLGEWNWWSRRILSGSTICGTSEGAIHEMGTVLAHNSS